MDVLKITMKENDADAATVGEYLSKLLCKVISEVDGFSGKRPFGNSDWNYELAAPLIEAGAIGGKLDGDGCVEDVDLEAMDAVLLGAIRKAFQ